MTKSSWEAVITFKKDAYSFTNRRNEEFLGFHAPACRPTIEYFMSRAYRRSAVAFCLLRPLRAVVHDNERGGCGKYPSRGIQNGGTFYWSIFHWSAVIYEIFCWAIEYLPIYADIYLPRESQTIYVVAETNDLIRLVKSGPSPPELWRETSWALP